MDDSKTDTLDELEAEPTGRSGEPRGPHLPDAIARVSFGVWVFGILALARLIWFVRETELGPAPGIATLVAYVGGLVPAVVAVLLPAVLLLRHPDAWTSARTLLIGTVLFAAAEGLRVLGPPLQPLFEQVTPGSEETPYLVPLTLLYTSIQGLLATYGVAEIALGLGRARRYLDGSGRRVVLAVAAIAVVVTGIARLISVSQLPFDQIPMTPTVAAYLASAIVLGVLSVAAWAFLAATVTGGSRAGEDPEGGWAIASLGTWLIVAVFTVSSILALARPSPGTQDVFATIGQVISVAYTLGYIALLAAFLLAMPSLEPLEETDDEAAGDEDDAEANADDAFDRDGFDGDGFAGDASGDRRMDAGLDDDLPAGAPAG